MTQPTDHGRDELATALQQARAALGSATDVARLRQGLEAKLAQGGESPLTAADSVGALWPKIVLMVALGGGALLYGLRPSGGARVSLPDAPRASRMTASASASSAPLGAAGSAPVANAPSSEAGRVRASAAAARAPAVSRARSEGSVSKASAAVGRNALMAVEPTHAEPAAPERVEVPSRGTLNPSQSDPEQEIALISRAQSELRVRPAAALLALDEHAARFARGVLAQERDALRIDAERALGRDARAREHARRFIALYPSSPQARPLARWLAEASAAEHKTSTPGRHTP